MTSDTVTSNLLISGDCPFVAHENEELIKNLERFWETEAIGIQETKEYVSQSKEEFVSVKHNGDTKLNFPGKVKHNGVRDTLTTLRENYWVLRGREAAKRIIKECVICRKFEGVPFKPQCIPDLPGMHMSDAHLRLRV